MVRQPERSPAVSERIRLTRIGYEKLKSEYEELTTKKRREIARALEHARAFGDLKENAEYDAAKNSQALNEKRISDMTDKLSCVPGLRFEEVQDAETPAGYRRFDMTLAQPANQIGRAHV